MGCCKQLLPLGEGTVIGRCLDTLIKGAVGEVVVVVPEEGQWVAEAVRGCPARVVATSHAEGDMASSVRCGRDALPAEFSAVIVALSDYPLVSAATVARLIEEYVNSPGCIIIPCHGGRRGHPLLLPRAVLDELTDGLILRDLVRRYPERIRCLNVDDPGVLIDMDTPEDYQRICGMLLPD
jgi:molybdenum cofactor cytidylyltransferase